MNKKKLATTTMFFKEPVKDKDGNPIKNSYVKTAYVVFHNPSYCFKNSRKS